MNTHRFVLIGIACLAFTVPHAQAQWSMNGVKIFYNAGNVGIGTNNPAYPLEVQGVATRAIFGFAKGSTGANSGVYGLASSTSGRGVTAYANAATGVTYGVFAQSNSTAGRAVYGLANSTSGANHAVHGKTMSGSGFAGYFEGGKNYFQNNVGIGTTAPTGKLDVVQNAAASPGLMVRSNATRIIAGYGNGAVVVGPVDAIAGVAFTAENAGGAGNQTSIIGHQVGNTYVSKIKMKNASTTITGAVGIGVVDPAFQLQLSANSAAKPSSSAWTVASDRRLKKNIHTIDGALNQLLRLRGVTYQWINPETQGDMTGIYAGMIAQEVEPVFPEWISEDASGSKSITTIGFEGLTVEALRDLRREKDAEIASLRAENDSQRKVIENLTERLAKLEQSVNRLAANESPAQPVSAATAK